MRANFVRKASTIDELKAVAIKGGSEYIIEAVVELEPEVYENFINNLLDDFDFIVRQKSKMFVDGDKVWHCVLVKAKETRDGILIESEGYDYARYAAYFPGEEVVK